MNYWISITQVNIKLSFRYLGIKWYYCTIPRPRIPTPTSKMLWVIDILYNCYGNILCDFSSLNLILKSKYHDTKKKKIIKKLISVIYELIRVQSPGEQ